MFRERLEQFTAQSGGTHAFDALTKRLKHVQAGRPCRSNWMGMRRYLAGASVWSRNQTGWRMMRTNIPEKLSNIVKEIDDHGSASLTRLTVLKKWFERTERLSAFAIWIATRAVSRQGKTSGAAAKLLREARGMLAGLDKLHPQLDRQTAQTMHDRLRDCQNEYRYQRWGVVRIIHNWNLMLVEHGLDIYLWHLDSPTHGYKLAADYCQHYDSRYGSGLIGPSRTKIQELVRFLSTIEALEDVWN